MKVTIEHRMELIRTYEVPNEIQNLMGSMNSPYKFYRAPSLNG